MYGRRGKAVTQMLVGGASAGNTQHPHNVDQEAYRFNTK
jgi:hypothetical protein